MRPSQYVILAFVIFYVVIFFWWSFSFQFQDQQPQVLMPILHSTSLWQQWNLFAPNPHLAMVATQIRITQGDYEVIAARPYVENGMPLHFSRLRKFDEKIIEFKHEPLIYTYLSHTCQKYRPLFVGEFTLTLEHTVQSIRNPQERFTTQLGEIICA